MSSAIATGLQGPTRNLERLDKLHSLPFALVHVACLGALWTGVSWRALGLCACLYVARMFAITAGYHRYFSHRSYRTSRIFQFLLALIACTSGQKGPLWWAAHHRHHHQHSGQESDVHSPEQRGFWWSHAGWILCNKYDDTNYDLVKDFSRYPELVWLNRHWLEVTFALGVASFLLQGWQGLFVGFFFSTVLLYHGTFAINSLCHMFGRVRYKTNDQSRNSLILALITFGEGWHNNHHHYSASTRMGFFWWEIDLTYYALKGLSLFGIVWDLKQPPDRVYNPASGPIR